MSQKRKRNLYKGNHDWERQFYGSCGRIFFMLYNSNFLDFKKWFCGQRIKGCRRHKQKKELMLYKEKTWWLRKTILYVGGLCILSLMKKLLSYLPFLKTFDKKNVYFHTSSRNSYFYKNASMNFFTYMLKYGQKGL